MALILSNVSKRLSAGFSLVVRELVFEESVIYAITGPPGSGKTAFLRIVGQLEFPDSGLIRLAEKSSEKSELVKGQVALVGQKPYLFNTTVRENVTAGISNISGMRLNKQRIDRVLEITGLTHVAKRPVHYLSYGEIRRVGLARALASGAKIILMDEPMHGLDPFGALQMENVLKRIHRQMEIGLILAVGDPGQVQNLAHQVLSLRRGQITKVTQQSRLNSLVSERAI